MPPPYSVATSLPTYDEAEKAKAAAMAAAAAETAQRVRQSDCSLLRIPFLVILSTFSNVNNSSLSFRMFVHVDCFVVSSLLLLMCVIIFW